MMKIYLLRLLRFILILQQFFVVFAYEDYCKSKKCGRAHIGCNNDGKFHANCPANAKKVNLEPFKALILREHNFLRNDVAGGGKKVLLPAAQMAEMKWDDELAYLAQLNVMNCKLSHDTCRDTKRFHCSGQNTALFAYTGKKYDKLDEQIIKERIADWSSEIKYATMKEINKYPANCRAGHFTIMVADHNNYVGCGAARYKIDDYSYFLLTCNYATNNIIHSSTYKLGQPGTKCKSGKSETYPNLCHPNEFYKNNK